jgi:hypothetical protein
LAIVCIVVKTYKYIVNGQRRPESPMHLFDHGNRLPATRDIRLVRDDEKRKASVLQLLQTR